MKYNINYFLKMNMTKRQHRRFEQFIFGDDLNFYEEYLINLSDDEQYYFFTQNPNFMSEFPVDRDKLYLLKDNIFRGILRRIKNYPNEVNTESKRL